MRHPFATTLVAAAALAAGAGSAQAANPVGFQLDLAGGSHVECFYTAGAKASITCLNYGATATGTCDAGGAVATRTLRRTGKPKSSTSCVDEGYHGYPKLKAGGTFSKGGFKCRLQKDRHALTCINATDKYAIWSAGTGNEA